MRKIKLLRTAFIIALLSVLQSPVQLLAEKHYKKKYTTAIDKFVLVDTNSDSVIRELKDNDIIEIASLPSAKISIVAVTSPISVGSVVFSLNAVSIYRVENTAPYSLAGDVNEDYYAWGYKPAEYTLTAVPYKKKFGLGRKGREKTISFKIVNEQINTPTPTSTKTESCTPSAAPTLTATPSAAPSQSPTIVSSPSPSASPNPTAAITTPTPSASAIPSAEPTPTLTPSLTPSPTLPPPSPSPSVAPSLPPTSSPSPASTPFCNLDSDFPDIDNCFQ
jgi:hypothetical protein